MPSEIRYDYIAAIHQFVSMHKPLQAYLKTIGASQKNFWSAFRSDLLRQNANTIRGYLCDVNSRLNHPEHANGFGTELYKKFFNNEPIDTVRDYIVALIYYCLELDAARLLLESTPASSSRKKTLKSILHLLEVK